MANQSSWEKYYQNTPLEKVPWNRMQADYFTEVIESGKVYPGTALDLGCGTGAKSIYLAQKGFVVTGIDISPTAIRHAKEFARQAQVKIRFIAADATDLSFLGNKKFDFVLDWANLARGSREKESKVYKRSCSALQKRRKIFTALLK